MNFRDQKFKPGDWLKIKVNKHIWNHIVHELVDEDNKYIMYDPIIYEFPMLDLNYNHQITSIKKMKDWEIIYEIK